MKLTGAEIIIEVLKEQGVDTVFGYPGGTVLDIYDALYRNGGAIRHILTAHEQGAAHAADGYARATGKTGVVIATSGPGATNLVTGIAAAYMDSSPLVAVTGNVCREALGSDGFQEVDIAGITLPITKYNFIVSDVESLADELRNAFLIASSGRKGPVLADVPLDVLTGSAEYEPASASHSVVSPKPDEAALNEAAQAISEAKCPLLLVGGGAKSPEACKATVEFSEKLNIPAVSTLMGLDVFPPRHPMFFGMAGIHGLKSANTAIAKCDLLIAVGTRFSEKTTGGFGSLAEGARVIHIDIDDAEIGKNIFADFPLCGDAAEILSLLSASAATQGHGQWIASLAANDNAEREEALHEEGLPKSIIGQLSALCGEDDIIVTDVGQHQLWTAQYFGFKKPRTFITSGGLGAMGFGLGAAVGAALAKPKSRVVLITGDGSFHMNFSELATLQKYKLPIKIILLNNGVLGLVRQWQKLNCEGRYSQTQPERKTDYSMLAIAFGIRYYKLTRDKQVSARLTDTLETKGPVLLECKISPEELVKGCDSLDR